MSRLISLFGIVALGSLVFANCVCVVARCDGSNCSGCCAADDTCDESEVDTSCGASGASCIDCTQGNQICASGACVTPLVGTYTVSETVTVTSTTGTSFTSPGDTTMTIVSAGTADTVSMNVPGGGTTDCTVTGTVTSGTNFSIGTVTCDPFTDNNNCTDTFTYNSGSGNLSGNNLSASLSGTYTQDNCPGGASGSGTFTVAISGTLN
jgi:hypothetical protein